MNRREFVTLVGVGGAVALAPEVVSANAEPTKNAKDFVKVATVRKLESSLLLKNSPVGPLLLIKSADGKTISAVDPTCPHEQCLVKWKQEQKLLVCPCHKAAFTSTGKLEKGPAKENLKAYQVKLEGDNILVKA